MLWKCQLKSLDVCLGDSWVGQSRQERPPPSGEGQSSQAYGKRLENFPKRRGQGGGGRKLSCEGQGQLSCSRCHLGLLSHGWWGVESALWRRRELGAFSPPRPVKSRVSSALPLNFNKWLNTWFPMVFCDKTYNKNQHRPQLQQDHILRHGNKEWPHHHHPDCRVALGYQQGPRWWLRIQISIWGF